jgi:alkylhydroperoxidase family enzyme
VSSELGISAEKITAVDDYAESGLFSAVERVALSYADAITLSDQDVSEVLFTELSAHFDQAAVVELTAVIAWENASSKFNRALRVASQNFWQPG